MTIIINSKHGGAVRRVVGDIHGGVWEKESVKTMGDSLMNEIIKALEAKYHPLGIIVYGSYADGTNNLNSDFDALLLTNGSSELHDSSVMSGVELDVWIYPRAKIEAPHDAYEFLQIWDGIIISDETGLLSRLQAEVREYIHSTAAKGREENLQNLNWCRKMLARTERGDFEGRYRRCWLLTDSLEIYCNIVGEYFFGAKKALRYMQQHAPDAAAAYGAALSSPTYENLHRWIEILEKNFATRFPDN